MDWREEQQRRARIATGLGINHRLERNDLNFYCDRVEPNDPYCGFYHQQAALETLDERERIAHDLRNFAFPGGQVSEADARAWCTRYPARTSGVTPAYCIEVDELPASADPANTPAPVPLAVRLRAPPTPAPTPTPEPSPVPTPEPPGPIGPEPVLTPRAPSTTRILGVDVDDRIVMGAAALVLLAGAWVVVRDAMQPSTKGSRRRGPSRRRRRIGGAALRAT